jgi:transcriptional/translational regulatory protein YebC/TACO1
VLTEPDDFETVRDAMAAADLAPEHSEITMRAETRAEVDGDSAETLLKLIDMLEDLDDVQQVYTNADIPDEALEATA